MNGLISGERLHILGYAGLNYWGLEKCSNLFLTNHQDLNQNMLLHYPENNGWIAMIIPAQPYERKDLLLPQQYQMNGKSKYAK